MTRPKGPDLRRARTDFDVILGCDKTVPAQLMGGISANKPVLPLITGPMMPGSYRGVRLGACTDCRNNWAAYRAGEIDMEDIAALNAELAPTVGVGLATAPFS